MNDQLYPDLTWDDLSRWAGATILERGIGYKRRVFDLSAVGDNHLAATVEGRYSYRTEVWFEDANLTWRCNCPFSRGPCKHAVALILVAIDYARVDTPIPATDRSEFKSKHNANLTLSPTVLSKRMDADKVRAALSQIPADQLVDWATKQITDKPELPVDLPQGIQPEDLRPDISVVTDHHVSSIQNLIRKVTGMRYDRYERDYENRRYGEEPDYSQIELEFQTLARASQVRELVELGDEFMSLGTKQIEETDPSLKPYDQLRSCMEIVVSAMRSSEISPADRVITYWKLMLKDEYDILSDTQLPVNEGEISQQDWLSVAEHFRKRLKSMPDTDDEKSFSIAYRRERVLERSIEAFKAGSAFDQAIELLESELPICSNYVALVDLLIQVRDFQMAKHWIVEGRNATSYKLRGIAYQLAEKMREIAVLEENWAQVTSIDAYFFAYIPSVDTYSSVKDSCRKSGVWEKIQTALLEYLVTGFFEPTSADWPLPATGLGTDYPIKRHYYPDYRNLIDIALEEDRLDDAVDWYRKAPGRDVDGLEIAERMRDAEPDITLEIWQRRIDYLVGNANVNAYLEAMPILREVKELMRDEGRQDEFERYVEQVRVAHKRKRRLLREIELVTSGHRRILDS